MKLSDILVVVHGGGEMATGCVRRLWVCGFRVAVLELPQPRCIRRKVCAANAIYETSIEVEDMPVQFAASVEEARTLMARHIVPVLIDEEAQTVEAFQPQVFVDARMTKEPQQIKGLAPVTIGLGPGFMAPQDADFVIETNRGPFLGRVIEEGFAEPDTGVPAPVEGYTVERVVRAPRAGTFQEQKSIGEHVEPGTMIGTVDGVPVRAEIAGIIRGILHSGLQVQKGEKIADIDPRDRKEIAFLVSDKANAIGGGCVEAVFRGLYRAGILER